MKNQAGTSQESEVFKASHGWFANSKKRTGIHNVLRHGEGASADKVAAYEFVKHFGELWEVSVLFPDKFSIVMKLVCFGRNCQTGPISHKKRSHCQGTSQ